MKQLKIAVVAMVIAAGAYGTYAFTNANNSVEKAPTQYWVTGVSGTEFNVSSNPDDARECDGSQIPCSITTSETPVAGKLTQAQMDSPNTTVHNYQNL